MPSGSAVAQEDAGCTLRAGARLGTAPAARLEAFLTAWPGCLGLNSPILQGGRPCPSVGDREGPRRKALPGGPRPEVACVFFPS